jgi:GMP synthase-like glutamine amidotransferase
MIGAMAPVPSVLILQHLSNDGPGFLATWLAQNGIAFEVRNAAVGDRVPTDLGRHAALAVLGGEMSANDDLPFLRDEERLIRRAMAAGRPVIGHCLGGQLMARALGATVQASPAPEIGWHPIALTAAARDWFGDGATAQVCQWHYEAFGLPPGATLLAGNAACPHQAFAIGPHLAMQFHIEVDTDKLEGWWHALDPAEGALLGTQPTLHPVDRMRADSARCLPASQALAGRLYARWWAAAAR